MALMPCKECGNQVSTDAKACPNCGAKPPKKAVSKWVVWGAIGITLYAVFAASKNDATTTSKASTTISESVRRASNYTPPPPPPPTWSYDRSTDAMTSKEATYASLNSKNSLALEFPYQGANYGTITVRQHPKHGLDVIISVDKGQILCHSYSDCSVSIRFDDGSPVTKQGSPPDDHSSTSVFLSDKKWFVQQASKAKRILVQLNMYKAGGQVLEFETESPLVWR